MSSSDPSRRRVLAGCVGGLSLALAGCAGVFDGTSTTSEMEGSDRAAVDSTHEYETRSVRSTDDDLFVFESESAAREHEDEAEDDHLAPYRRSIVFILEDDDASRLWIDAAEDVETELRSFVADTDFETQSVVVDQRPIEDCYRRRLLGVRASDDTFRTSYCQSLKAPTESCDANVEVMEAVAVRVHRAYDEAPSSRGSSESMSCSSPRVESSSDPTGNESATDDRPEDADD